MSAGLRPGVWLAIPTGRTSNDDITRSLLSVIASLPHLISARGAPPPLASLRRPQTRCPRDSRGRCLIASFHGDQIRRQIVDFVVGVLRQQKTMGLEWIV